MHRVKGNPQGDPQQADHCLGLGTTQAHQRFHRGRRGLRAHHPKLSLLSLREERGGVGAGDLGFESLPGGVTAAGCVERGIGRHGGARGGQAQECERCDRQSGSRSSTHFRHPVELHFIIKLHFVVKMQLYNQVVRKVALT